MNGRTVFVAVRHGNYDGNQNLSSAGARQMMAIAGKVQSINRDYLPISLLCSTAPRAEQGGKIIGRILRIPPERMVFDQSLWEDNTHFGNRSRVWELIDAHLWEDGILLGLSHLDMVPRMAYYVAKKLGHDPMGFGNSGYGCGWLVNEHGFFKFPQL